MARPHDNRGDWARLSDWAYARCKAGKGGNYQPVTLGLANDGSAIMSVRFERAEDAQAAKRYADRYAPAAIIDDGEWEARFHSEGSMIMVDEN